MVECANDQPLNPFYRRSMKPGYYLSEKGSFQVWYPLDLFEKDMQRMDVIWEDGTEETIDYMRTQALLVNMVFDFEFLGEL